MWIKRLAAALTACCLLAAAGGAALGEGTGTPIPEGERPAFVQRERSDRRFERCASAV